MRNHRLGTVSVSIACLLAACGGGGGGQGSDFGAGLAINVSTLSFSATANQAPPPPQTVLATISAADAATIGVGYTNGNEPVSWLQATITTQPNVATANVSFTVTPLFSPGTYTAHPSIGIFRSDHSPIAVRTVTVTFQVLPQAPSISSSSVAMTMQANSNFAAHQQLLVSGSGTWTATVNYTSGANWLMLGNLSTFPQTGPGNTLLDLSP
ncbi:MAG: hypothetical protein ACJ79H_20025, partial [Myxococcales bacterium]